MRPNRTTILWLAFLLTLTILFTPSLASADTIVYTLGLGNRGSGFCGGSGNPTNCGTNYATVTLNLVDSHTITVTENTLTGYTLSGAGQAIFGFNYSGSGTLSISGISSTLSNGTQITSGWSSGGSKQMDGFGYFEYHIDYSGGQDNNNLGTMLTFTVTSSNGFTSVSQLDDRNSKNYAFATHLYGQGITGFAGAAPGGGTSPIPEPASIALIGSGVAALGGYFRKRKAKPE